MTIVEERNISCFSGQTRVQTNNKSHSQESQISETKTIEIS